MKKNLLNMFYEIILILGEDELDVSKLSTVIRSKYGSISASQEKLGTAQDIQETFIDFQANLYEEISV